MSVKRKQAVGYALDHCGKEGGCDECPYLGGPCDMPFIEYVTLPVHLLEDIRAEMYEPESPWKYEEPEEMVQ